MNYTKEILETWKEEKIQMLKEIFYTLYELEKEDFQSVIFKAKREDILTLYNVCKTYETDNFMAYYKRTLINKYSS